MAARANRQPPHSPGDQDTNASLRLHVSELTDLVQQLMQRMDKQSTQHSAPSTVPTTVTSITSTLSSASHSALSQCDTFLSKISSQFETFLHEHSIHLVSLYSRSNCSDSRETQFDNLLRFFTVSSSSSDKRTDTFCTAVENNTAQVARLVAELSRWNSPQAPTPTHDTIPVNTPATQVREAEVLMLPITSLELPAGTPPSFTMPMDTDTNGPLHTGSQQMMTTCTESASTGIDLRHCNVCNRPIHQECLTPDSSMQLCLTCAATLHSDSENTAIGDAHTSQPDQKNDSLQDSAPSSPSTVDSSSSTEEMITLSHTPKRLSPRGKQPRAPATRFT